jgi:hypothetical protein
MYDGLYFSTTVYCVMLNYSFQQSLPQKYKVYGLLHAYICIYTHYAPFRVLRRSPGLVINNARHLAADHMAAEE